ncbi:GIY-YIG nuclease family protein [Limnohabitans sp. 63ED37-2]|uniref:GIY-YIG nuclease family protein n=1 Tax=Limnohabitans sp. 63ED37-2 TaxID=1678128 RepID=UPI00070575FF|nr:GIY-YIG nuclease family protein [Limnohabitans sp. 63ED37-2]ALK87795.1 T5 domain protein [Limnohabitans sp. 63ED37-2]
MSDLSADEILDALGVEVTPVKTSALTPFEERVIAGFEDIQRFFEEHKRLPVNSEGRDIFERLYAVRLEQLRKLPQALAILALHDTHGLLRVGPAAANIDSLNEDALLAELGVDLEAQPTDDITVLRHVRSNAERRNAEEIANRTPCKNFNEFQPLFEQAERELKSGNRTALRFGRDASIQLHDFFILDGQFAYVAEVGDTIKMETGHDDARLRVIFGNGTESNLLLRSLQKALWKDETGRRLTVPDMGPLFSDTQEQDDIETGTIYVLRSKSSHPYVSEHRELIHKIGVTGGKVETRISGADKDATYLLADVEVVATYKLHNINRVRMENLFHKIFSSAQIDITIDDRFGNSVKPREWFLVPLHVIDQAVQHIMDGSITEVIYDTPRAQLVRT